MVSTCKFNGRHIRPIASILIFYDSTDSERLCGQNLGRFLERIRKNGRMAIGIVKKTLKQRNLKFCNHSVDPGARWVPKGMHIYFATMTGHVDYATVYSEKRCGGSAESA